MSRIPLPGAPGESFLKGLDTGSSMFSRIMQPVMQQRGLEQASLHHKNNMGFKMQQLEQLQNQFELQQALREAAEQRRLQESEFNRSQQPLKLDKLRAEIEKNYALAEKARQKPQESYKPSELERIATILGEGDPEKRNALLAEGAATKYGLTLPGSEKLPIGSQPFKSLPKNLQAQENADQIKMQTRVNDSSKAMHDLDEMEKIINSNPDMAGEWTYILANPEDKSFLANIARKYTDKKKLAAIEKFTKYSNDFVLSAGGGLGNNFTDAKLKALQLSKMNAGNTDIANKSIIDNYKSRLKPLINYGRELKKARGKYTLPYFEESYTDDALLAALTDEELAALSEGK